MSDFLYRTQLTPVITGGCLSLRTPLKSGLANIVHTRNVRQRLFTALSRVTFIIVTFTNTTILCCFRTHRSGGANLGSPITPTCQLFNSGKRGGNSTIILTVQSGIHCRHFVKKIITCRWWWAGHPTLFHDLLRKRMIMRTLVIMGVCHPRGRSDKRSRQKCGFNRTA